jgi:hypothetical protein
MKKSVLMVLFFLFFAGIAFAQKFPVTGRWKLQIIGTTVEFFIEIDGTRWTFESNGDSLLQIATIDNAKKTLSIPLLTGVADYFIFDIKTNYIDLKAGGKFNIALLDILRNGMEGMEGINDITDEFIGKLLEEVEKIFYTIPIMRLYPVK